MELGAKRCPPNNVLYLVIWVLVTWIAVNFICSSSDELKTPVLQLRDQSIGPQPAEKRHRTPSRWRTEAEERSGNGKCDTKEGHYQYELVDARSEEYPWNQMKWIGQPADCPVRGELIERLDALNNFRRGFALGFSHNVEDRLHILPWLLGTRVDLNRRKRRVLLDLGSNSFSSSIQWFLRMYPCDFTEIYAFEIQPSLLEIPPAFDEQSNTRPENHPSSRRTKSRPGIPAWMLKRIKVYNKLVSDGDDLETEAINITRFIIEDLRLEADDTVIVKMDIEGSEWPILTRWMNDPQMVQIVDEIFVEVHYKHPSMYNYNWHKFSRGRDQAKRLLAELRWKGFYIHFWP